MHPTAFDGFPPETTASPGMQITPPHTGPRTTGGRVADIAVAILLWLAQGVVALAGAWSVLLSVWAYIDCDSDNPCSPDGWIDVQFYGSVITGFLGATAFLVWIIVRINRRRWSWPIALVGLVVQTALVLLFFGIGLMGAP